MSRTLLGLWAIIASSIVAVAALAAVWNYRRKASARLRLAELLTRQLEPFNRDIADVFETYDRQLQHLDQLIPALAQRFGRSSAIHWSAWWLSSKTTGRRANWFIRNSTAHSWPITAWSPMRSSGYATATLRNGRRGGCLWPSGPAAQVPTGNQLQQPPAPHWTTWYHGRGLVLGYWASSSQNTITMVIVPRGRWLSDIVAAMPDNRAPRDDALIQLVDVEGSVVTQWGNLDLVPSSQRDAELAVVAPLEGWRLRLTLSPQARKIASGIHGRTATLLGVQDSRWRYCCLEHS